MNGQMDKQDTENVVITEKCIRCGKETEVLVGTPVEKRKYFVDGSGQLCKECYDEVYGREVMQLD